MLAEEGKRVGPLVPDLKQCSKIAEHCNERKSAAKKVQEASSNLFLCLFLRHKPMNIEALVLSLGERYINVVVPLFREEQKIFMEDMCIKSFKWDEETKKLTIVWPATVGNKE